MRESVNEVNIGNTVYLRWYSIFSPLVMAFISIQNREHHVITISIYICIIICIGCGS